MSIRRICKQSNLWPIVIADLIADYAGVATEDKIRWVIETYSRGGCCGMYDGPLQLLWHKSNGEWVDLSGYGRPDRRISIAELAAAIDMREWPWIAKQYKWWPFREPLMYSGEANALISWISSVGLPPHLF